MQIFVVAGSFCVCQKNLHDGRGHVDFVFASVTTSCVCKLLIWNILPSVLYANTPVAVGGTADQLGADLRRCGAHASPEAGDACADARAHGRRWEGGSRRGPVAGST